MSGSLGFWRPCNSCGKSTSRRLEHASPTERRLLIEIAKKDAKFVSPGAFNEFKGASKLFARLQEEELLIRSERAKYSLFTLFSRSI